VKLDPGGGMIVAIGLLCLVAVWAFARYVVLPIVTGG
jgi:hypothetical protein